jgi:hypothetical protein
MKSSFHRLIPFLPLFCNCQLNSIPLLPSPYPGRLASRNSTLHSSESEAYVTTDGQSASLSWYKAPVRGLRPDFYFRSEYGIRLTVTFLIPWGALSDERMGLSFVCAVGPCQRSLFRVLVSWDLRPYFTVSDLRLPFRRFLRLAGSRWRYSIPPPRTIRLNGWLTLLNWILYYNHFARTTQKTASLLLRKSVYSTVT